MLSCGPSYSVPEVEWRAVLRGVTNGFGLNMSLGCFNRSSVEVRMEEQAGADESALISTPQLVHFRILRK